MNALTKNEIKVIQMLLENGNTSNTEISLKLKVSKQAVGKIINRLEYKNIIKGYSVNLDLKNLGIDILCFIKLSFNGGDAGTYQQMRKSLVERPEVFRANTSLAGRPSLILLCGFKSIEKLNNFVKGLAEQNKLNVEEVLIHQPVDVLKDSNKDLIRSILKS